MLAQRPIPLTPNFKATTYTYDGEWLRTGRATKQHMTWTATGLPLLIDDTNNAYLYGPSGRAIAQVSTSDDVTYLHTDHLGSVRAITNSTADVIGTASYSAYGEANTTGVVSSLAYAGQYTDPESGLQYLRARYYDPQTGQFITRDPIENVTGDPYGYANGNPVMNADPTGLFAIALPAIPYIVEGSIIAGAAIGLGAACWAGYCDDFAFPFGGNDSLNIDPGAAGPSVNNAQRGNRNVSGTPNPSDQAELDKQRRGEPHDRAAANRAKDWEKRNQKADRERNRQKRGGYLPGGFDNECDT